MWPREKFNPLDFSAVRFLIVGIVNTFIGLLIIYVMKWFVGTKDVVANMAGYGCGLGLSFVLNKRWSFQYNGAIGCALLRFLLLIFVSYLFNLGVTLVAIKNFGVNSYLAQALGVAPYTVITYLGSRYLVFPNSQKIFETTN